MSYSFSRLGLLCVTAFWLVATVGANEPTLTGKTRLAKLDLLRHSSTSLEFTEGDYWELDDTERQRAQRLHQEFRQYVSVRQISPLEVLGIHARSEAERKRYARRWAQLMIEDADRTLAFQRAYDEAIRELLQHKPVIDISKLPPRVSRLKPLVATDRLILFTKPSCEVCDEVLGKVLSVSHQVKGVDIYLLELNSSQEADLHRWAKDRRISPVAVRSKHITLNFDDGLLARLHPRVQTVPVLMRRRADQFETIDPWSL